MKYLEYIGYLSSFLILISMMMKSIVKLRAINLMGSLLFVVYALLFRLYPIVLLNAAISITNIYYLITHSRNAVEEKKKNIDLIAVVATDLSILSFYNQHKDDIEGFFGVYDKYTLNKVFLLLDNNNIVGLLAGNLQENNFTILVDYVLESYRDYSVGNFIYHENTQLLKDNNISHLNMRATNPIHQDYLQKMGFRTSDHINYSFDLS